MATKVDMKEKKRQHLEFLQNVITRMNSNSFFVKGWAITIATALIALSASNSKIEFLLISILPILIFWGVDAYYLSQERKYRELFKDTVSGNADLYNMDASAYHEKKVEWSSCLFSKTILPIYGSIIVTVLLILFLNGFFSCFTKCFG